MWQVLQLVPYIRENAGIAKLLVVLNATTASTVRSNNLSTTRNEFRCMPVLLGAFLRHFGKWRAIIRIVVNNVVAVLIFDYRLAVT